MFKIKRLYTFMLQTFLPLFIMTFGICLFIVLMQFLWKYIDDMVGKGLDMSVLGEMFLYAALYLLPIALPLTILLASLMTFGNLGERLELLAMKSAGVSLIHSMRPLIILLGGVGIGAFFFQNNAMPVIQIKLHALLYSMRQKSPELDIPEGAFCTAIEGYNVYVKKKSSTGLLQDLMIYDYSGGFNNARIIVADSGRMKTSANKLFLVLSLFNGESFENMKKQAESSNLKIAVPYRRETFESKEIFIEFDGNFSRADESFMANMYMGKQLRELQTSIDSMSVRLDSIKALNAKTVYEMSYKRTFSNPKIEADRQETTHSGLESTDSQAEKANEPIRIIHFDSLCQAQSPGEQAALLVRSKSAIESAKTDYFFKAAVLGDEAYKVRRHQIEWHKKFTLSFACIMFFFIGAPLGAIIRKGGLGMPVIISVILFIFYYIIDNIGYKMARDGVWDAWVGMWLSSAVLALLGVFLTYKSVNDSVILNADTYLNAFKNLIGKRSGRKVERKEVILFTPDYTGILPRLNKLTEDSTSYLTNHKRRLNYFIFWKQGGKESAAEQLAAEMESIVEELSNSDQNLILNKLMDYPIINGYNQLNANFSGKVGLILGVCFPIGFPIYLFATYQRKLLCHDIRSVQKTSRELEEMIKNLKTKHYTI